jgi:hypothetical protein
MTAFGGPAPALQAVKCGAEEACRQQVLATGTPEQTGNRAPSQGDPSRSSTHGGQGKHVMTPAHSYLQQPFLTYLWPLQPLCWRTSPSIAGG